MRRKINDFFFAKTTLWCNNTRGYVHAMNCMVGVCNAVKLLIAYISTFRVYCIWIMHINPKIQKLTILFVLFAVAVKRLTRYQYDVPIYIAYVHLQRSLPYFERKCWIRFSVFNFCSVCFHLLHGPRIYHYI